MTTNLHTLTVTKAGGGNGTVAGGTINCGTTCSADFASGAPVTAHGDSITRLPVHGLG